MSARTLSAAAIGFSSGHPIDYTGALADHPLVEFLAVGDVPGDGLRSDMARKFAEDRGVPYYEDYRAMLDHTKPDIVSLCVTPEFNPAVVREVSNRGIHMLSEKPFARTLAEAEEAACAVRRAGVVFSLDVPSGIFPRPLLRALESAREGRLGEVRVAYCHFLQPKGPRYTYRIVDGKKEAPPHGELQNFGPYAFLAMSKIVGRPAERVFARTGTFFYDHYRTAGIEDMCLASITFGGGAVAHVLVGRTPTESLPTADFKLEIFGSRGALCVDDCMGDKFEIWGPYVETDDRYERGGLEYLYFSSSHIALYVQDVVGAVLNKREPLITIDDTMEIMRFVDGCQRSASTGQPVRCGGGGTT